MRHSKSKHRLNRFSSWRKATLESLVRSVIISQSIKTTKAKAKAAKPLLEKLISFAKDDTLAARRSAFRILKDHRLVKYLFTDIGKRFSSRQGGYSRIINFGNRRGDNAELVIFSLTEIKKTEKKKTKKEKSAPKPEIEQPKEPDKGLKAAAQIKENAENKKTSLKTADKKPLKKFLGGVRDIFKKDRNP